MNGLPSIYGLGHDPETATVHVLSVPWEATTSYGRGTAHGPAAVIRESVQVDLFDLVLAELGRRRPSELVPPGEPHEAGIAALAVDPTWQSWSEEASRLARTVIADYEAGQPRDVSDPTLARVNELTQKLDRGVADAVRAAEDAGRFVALLGGDHAVAYGSILARAERYPRLGVLQFDAHADLRVAYQGFVGSHASVMHRVLADIPAVDKLVSVGVRDLCREEYAAIEAAGSRVVAFLDRDRVSHAHAGRPFDDFVARVVEALPENVYVSFDIDGLDPRFCPHTGTPVPGGLSFDEAVAIVVAVVASGRRIVGCDLVEVAPGEGDDTWDANVGARLLYKLIGCALVSPAPHVRRP